MKRDENYSEYSDASFILVKNTVQALQLLAAYKRKAFKSSVIAVTGSAGKTVVKEWLAEIIGQGSPVVRSPKSYNSQIGVPLSVWKLEDKYKYGIFEAGISHPGEMENLQKVIDPDIGVITNIGDAHRENFPDDQTKAAEKLILFKNSKTIIYCRDQKIIHNLFSTTILRSKNLIDWSFKSRDAKVYAETTLLPGGHTGIRYCLRMVKPMILKYPSVTGLRLKMLLQLLPFVFPLG